MKKFIIPVIALFATVGVSAQTVISDTVTTGQHYVNHKFYSMADGELATLPSNSWTFAMGTTMGMSGAPIRFNPMVGTIKLVPNAFPDVAIMNVDTTGYSAQPELANSAENLNIGALNISNDPNDQFDYSWGEYNMGSHNVESSRTFGATINGEFYLVRFTLHSVQNIMDVIYSKYQAADSTVYQLDFNNYTNKKFVYTDIAAKNLIDAEPANWDLFFGQYTQPIPYQGTVLNYPVAGVLNSLNTQVAKVTVNSGDQATYTLTGNETYETRNDVIDYTWKAAGQGGVTIYDSLVYFVKANDGANWKMWFTNFISGSGTDALAGSFIFNKQLISGVGTKEIKDEFFTQLYPNPANDNVQLVVDAENPTTVDIYSLTGAKVYSETISGGLQNHVISTASLKDGLYQVVVSNENGQRAIQKLMVKH